MINLQTFSLQSARTLIRPITAADRDALFAVYSDPEVMRYTSDPPFTDRAMLDQFLASVQQGYQSGAYYEFAVVLAPQTVIGTCSLHSFDPDQAAAEVGFLLHRNYWRRGLMAEALSVLLQYVFTTLRLRVVYADVDEPNTPSRMLLLKLGFQAVAGTATMFAYPAPQAQH